MEGWKTFLENIDLSEMQRAQRLQAFAQNNFKMYGVYPNSINVIDQSLFFIARQGGEKVLVVYGSTNLKEDFKGRDFTIGVLSGRVCALTNENCKVLQSIFPFTKPLSHRSFDITLGLGDRLGLASPGHIRLISGSSIFPVLAQQSIRELSLTGRTFEDVLCAASWAVFQEGYTMGFGADGDHLKTPDEIKAALEAGFTMITLDCSDHIDNHIAGLSPSEVDERYSMLPEKARIELEKKYLGKEFALKDGTRILFEHTEFKRTVLIYSKAIEFTTMVYHDIVKSNGRDIDFEMSIDETFTPTSPASHFFVASELIGHGVELASLAPRFCGEFQKGIDYIGSVEQFEEEFSIHARIAEHFGYKISVHSGSDKFKVFPIVGRLTKGKYHLKTAGTNWLEALRIIAQKNPSLYRKIHSFAISRLEDAKKYYHIGARLENIPDIDTLSDSELPKFMDKDDSRQVLHITYGLILTARNPEGKHLFRDEIYETLNTNEDCYYEALEKHIGRHLEALGAARPSGQAPA